MTNKLAGVEPEAEFLIAGELHPVIHLRLSDIFKAFIEAPTDERLCELAQCALNYQTSYILGKERHR